MATFSVEQFIDSQCLAADKAAAGLRLGESLRGLSRQEIGEALAFVALAATQQDSGHGQFDWQHKDTNETFGVLAAASNTVARVAFSEDMPGE